MSSSSSSFSSSSSPNSNNNLHEVVADFDVFLSFRGEDTRSGFTSYLHDALVREGIRTFFDNDNLVRGKAISPELTKAIQSSRSSVVVLSENYATSSWCLTELCKIVECMDTSGLIVLPIFYHVNPSHVRKQLGSYKEAFEKHENNPKLDIEEVETWRSALKSVGNLAGWALKETDVEAKFMKEFIADLSSQLDIKKESAHEPARQSRSQYYTSKEKDVINPTISKDKSAVKKFGFSGVLHSLTTLDLSDRNLSDGAFPDCFDSLVSLENLILSNNPFTVLPPSISGLSKLKCLELDNCKDLRCLGPELPSSLQVVKANHCTSLWSFLDPSKASHLRCSAFCVDCFELVSKQGGQTTAFASLKRYLQDPPNPRRSSTFDVVLHGLVLTSPWFVRFTGSSSVSFTDLDPEWCNDEWMGFAWAVRFDSRYAYDFCCDVNFVSGDNCESATVGCSTVSGSSSVVWLCYVPRDFLKIEWENLLGCEELSFSFHSKTSPMGDFISSLPVGCGVFLVYKKDIEDLNQIFLSASTSQEKENATLKSLKKYRQDQPDQSVGYDIVLPGNEIPAMFSKQSSGPSTSTRLHPNWCNISSEIITKSGSKENIWLLYLTPSYFPTKWLQNSNGVIQFSFYTVNASNRGMESCCGCCGPCGVRLAYEKQRENLEQED
ncbi:hypothetical protein FNV43_RR10057 [Rhamnella rubrinervis]|uniref:ADP-ribosyl cyclase/cyclic ADP-ribose hydrolase n=1 Tax=Rhamnella rubrinervis TaxID=2594499 RepID=A0A8K0MKD4_9ROSA|nr:hypothetical protein FNV43_RR10057 [Rhamnella rubrinervis]